MIKNMVIFSLKNGMSLQPFGVYFFWTVTPSEKIARI
jgi:hypothetical protein